MVEEEFSEIHVEIEFTQDKRKAMIIFESENEIKIDDLIQILKTLVLSKDNGSSAH
jgi:ribosomal protein S17